MRMPAIIIGILLLVAGALTLSGTFKYTDNKEVLKIGDASLTVQQEKSPPKGLGYGLLAVGAIAMVLGATGKK